MDKTQDMQNVNGEVLEGTVSSGSIDAKTRRDMNEAAQQKHNKMLKQNRKRRHRRV